MLKKISLPLSIIDGTLSLSPDKQSEFIRMLSAFGHGENPDCPAGLEDIWDGLISEINRQRKTAETHARCGSRGGRPRKSSVDYDDGESRFTEEMNKAPVHTVSAVDYIESSGIRMTPNFWEQFREFTVDSGLPDDLVMWAVDKAASKKDAGWPYVRAILDRCITQNIKTVDEAKAAEEKRRSERRKNGPAFYSGRLGEEDIRSAQDALRSQYGAVTGTEL